MHDAPRGWRKSHKPATRENSRAEGVAIHSHHLLFRRERSA